MAPRGRKYKFGLIFGLSNINADSLQLVLCMFVSHYMLGNPLYGAALFLFANIWTLYFQGNLHSIKFRPNRSAGLIMWILLIASVLAGLALMFFYPVLMNAPRANYVSFFVLIVTARSVITYMMNKTYGTGKTPFRHYKTVLQLLFIVPCALFAIWLMSGPALWITIGGFALTGLLLSFQSSTLASFSKYIRRNNRDKLDGIFSYDMFSGMTLYSRIAFSLGILMYICYMSFQQQSSFEYNYLGMALWLAVMLLWQELFSRLAKRRGWTVGIGFLLVGAIMWILASVKIYDGAPIVMDWVWTLLWGFGLALVTSVADGYNDALKMVAGVAGKKISDRDLYFRNMLTQIIAVITANAVMLCVVTVVSFVIPTVGNMEVPGLLRRVMILLPVVFMIVSIVFAARQPLDRRSRQKLANYTKGVNRNKPTQENLAERLVKKSKMRFGIRVLTTVARPFLRLKVIGEENIQFSEFPSIFVCNHGVIYGPVAAIIYLPTYFRPWSDKKMTCRELCQQEMYKRNFSPIPLLPAGVKKWISRFVSGPVTWAINSFDPIPVDKSSLRGVAAVFEDTVTALTEGDNVLIFPEKPRRVKKKGGREVIKHETDTVGRLFTGFASIGKLYYERTGKTLNFYPIYANRKGRTFSIGEPVRFNPDNDAREEKQRITEELHTKMLGLCSG